MSAIHARFKVNYPGFSLDVDLDLPGRGVTALFGESGSGKTTCLRAIAGLERTANTYLSVNGAVWQDDARGILLPAYRRPVGYVFQEVSLFEHLNVRRNLDYGVKRVPAAERRVSLAQVVDLLGIAHLLDRKPGTLSGGECQRVSIARALAVSPAVLLMDEPLAALDAKRKGEIIPYLERLHDELEIPVIYVSHSLEEVARLADFLVLLEEGRIVASGQAVDMMTRLDQTLAHGDSASALIIATVTSHDAGYHLTCVDFPGGALMLPYHPLQIGQRVRVRIQARDVSLTLEKQTGTSILNILPATVLALSDDSPGQVIVALDAGGARMLARVTRKSVAALELIPGKAVYAQIKSVAILG
ncbi:MAG: molybdenum ABC transporter ATP-binding protein [Candidatus Hydrogenedentes bacterium]|nr:molybdenum ABC transporter ATP-binding protein [Candidatus Hydrogenedentota bacterium]